ncbi:MAG: hypothetical protein MK132_22155 [Lentisphaerales bacterium]|nr:hypothetical protein [Lentisphaerales bacterium]
MHNSTGIYTGIYTGNDSAKHQRFTGFLVDHAEGHFSNNSVKFWRKLTHEYAMLKCPTDDSVQFDGNTILRRVSYRPNSNLWNAWSGDKNGPKNSFNTLLVENPSNALLMGDGRKDAQFIRQANSLKTELYFGDLELDDYGGIILRHQKRSANFIYLDGHVDNQKWPGIETPTGEE